ncbi:integration host factor, actinobacterial type [Amycolatopsis vastitatis]|uniref:Integration host factor n=1 Tax=Amycolatopsis vastitatis TaxID=1905142 RepID=A0A229SR33_9PSEU|nr:integration host factor, actinobacterial type [Amycolatopsis vastitatis]OXM61283.1 integration host factor [Amycolatopsis vastitatis]
MPSRPELTDERRRLAREKAAEARLVRAELLGALRNGDVTVAQVLARADAGDPVVRQTRVLRLARSLPGFGDVAARELLARLRIDERRRIGGLGRRQRDALLAATSDAPGR